MARHAYPAIDNLTGHLAEEIAARVEPNRGNVWRMLCWSPITAARFIDYSEAIRNLNEIPEDIREIMIIRLAHRCAAPYELHHHHRIGRSVGLTDGHIAACDPEADSSGLPQDMRFALELTDQLIRHHRLDEATFDQAISAYDPKTVTDMILLVGFYTMASMFLNSFDIQVETPV